MLYSQQLYRSGPSKAKSGENLGQQFHTAPEHPNDLGLLTTSNIRRSSFSRPMITPSTEDLQAGRTPSQRRSGSRTRPLRRYSDASKAQDILEVWFAGNHSGISLTSSQGLTVIANKWVADIGGGWSKAPGEVWSLSHVPLVWMIHEAEKAELPIDPQKMSALNCCPDEIDDYGNRLPNEAKAKNFRNMFHQSGTEGYLHDSLAFGGGLPWSSVVSVRIPRTIPLLESLPVLIRE